jgi:hypothetical protein
MLRSILPAFLLAALCGASACGSANSDKCRSSCDPTVVMACVGMDASTCERDCEALTSGLTTVCATCLTQVNAWKFQTDQRFSGSSSVCRGYSFPSITSMTGGGCGAVCVAGN